AILLATILPRLHRLVLPAAVLLFFGSLFRSRCARLRGRDVASSLPEGFVEHHRAGSGGVERAHYPFHRKPDRLVRAFQHQTTDPLPLAADHDRGRSAVIDLVVEQIAGLVGRDDPDALLLERVDRLPEIRDVGDEQVLARAGARLGDRGREPHGAMVWDDDAVYAGALGRPEEHAEVLRVLQRVND